MRKEGWTGKRTDRWTYRHAFPNFAYAPKNENKGTGVLKRV